MKIEMLMKNETFRGVNVNNTDSERMQIVGSGSRSQIQNLVDLKGTELPQRRCALLFLLYKINKH